VSFRRVSAARFDDLRANEVNPGAAAVSSGAVLAGTQGGGVLAARAGPAGLEVARVGGVGRREVSAISAVPGGALVGIADGAVLRISCAPGVPAS
jgi:ABC-type nitrate/sulfonate/bicarbonate transport system substrate-binding protein